MQLFKQLKNFRHSNSKRRKKIGTFDDELVFFFTY